MSEPLDLDAIKARLDALSEHSTTGDWHYDGSDDVKVFPATGGQAELVANVWAEPGSEEEQALGTFIAHSRGDVDALVTEVERDRRTLYLQSGMISELTAACMAAEAERDRLRAELETNRQRWYHNDQGRTECVAGHDPATWQCVEGGGPVFSQVEHLTQLVEIWQGLAEKAEDAEAKAEAEVGRIRTRARARSEELLAARDRAPMGDDRRRRFEFAASELRALVAKAVSE